MKMRNPRRGGEHSGAPLRVLTSCVALVAIACGQSSSGSQDVSSGGGSVSGGANSSGQTSRGGRLSSDGGAQPMNAAGASGAAVAGGGSGALGSLGGAGSASSLGGAEAVEAGTAGAAAGASIGGASAAQGGAAGAAEVGGSSGSGGDVGVAPGTCGVARRISIPNASTIVAQFNSPSSYGAMRRVANGFTEGSTSKYQNATVQNTWVRVDADGTQTMHTVETESLLNVNDFVSFGPTNRIFHIGGDWTTHYVAAFGDEGNAKLTKGPTLYEEKSDPDFRFFRHGVAVSLDGERALVMSAFIAAHGPRLALIDRNAARLGEAVELPESLDCQLLIPTEHGAAISTAADGIRWVEFGPTGSVIEDVEVPLGTPQSQRPSCPQAALSEQGFALLTFDPFGGWTVIRVDEGNTQVVDIWTELVGTPIAFAIKADSVIAVTRNVEGYHAVRRKNGKDEYFTIDLGSGGKQIPSEAGHSSFTCRTVRKPSQRSWKFAAPISSDGGWPSRAPRSAEAQYAGNVGISRGALVRAGSSVAESTSTRV